MAKDRPRGLRLIGQAKRKVAFHQPFQRLGGVGRGLILLDHDAEAVDRGLTGGGRAHVVLLHAAAVHVEGAAAVEAHERAPAEAERGAVRGAEVHAVAQLVAVDDGIAAGPAAEDVVPAAIGHAGDRSAVVALRHARLPRRCRAVATGCGQ